MDMLHLIQLQDVPWQPHPTIAGVQTKIFENKASNPEADVLMALVAPDGKIPWHVHESARETAYVLQGQGVILCAPDKEHLQMAQESPLAAGCALTVQVGVWHSVLNTSAEPLILFAFHTPPTF
jgi:mannose-6-phosphate isomerase-like protein (cupin superfamily)